jgi:hypothetical protein
MMLTRRLLSSSSSSAAAASPSYLRSFASSAAYQRAPSLADITPNSAPAFESRQKEFRESLKTAQKAQEQQDSQFVNTPTSRSASSFSTKASPASTAPSSSDASPASNPISKLALGSSTSIEAAREEAFQRESTKRKGALSSLIYGTAEGQQMDKEIEKSFSQVLARGKYVHSIVFHQVRPDKVDQYVKLVGEWYPKMAGLKENHVHLVGSWRTEVGDCDTFGMGAIPLMLRHRLDSADELLRRV